MNRRDEILSLNDAGLSALCRLEFFRGSGPGGQKRNKSSSAVRATLDELGIVAEDCTERSQFRNRANALRKLKLEAALKIRVLPAVPPEAPECSLESPAYPLFAAQLLDVLSEAGGDHRAAAEKCRISPTKLVKKLYRDPRLWQFARRLRAEAGLPELSAPK